jgi:hypothetical protein
MKRPVFPAPFLTAIVLLMAAAVFVACEDLGGTGVIGTSLSESATSSPALSTVPGETTTAASAAAATTTPASLAAATTVTHSSAPPTFAAGTTIHTVATEPPTVPTEPPTVPTEPPALPYHFCEEDDPHLQWDGSWTVIADPQDSGGSCRFAEHAGASVKFHFYGTSIALYARIGPAVGEATITLDNDGPITVDCYSPVLTYQAPVWGVAVERGSHTVTIEMPGTSNPASGSKGIYVDAVSTWGQLE